MSTINRMALYLGLAVFLTSGCTSVTRGRVGDGIVTMARCLLEHPDWTTARCVLLVLTSGGATEAVLVADGWSADAAELYRDGHLFPDAGQVSGAEGFSIAQSGCPVSGCVSNCSAPPERMRAALCGDGLAPAWSVDAFGQTSSAGAVQFHYNAASCSVYQSFARSCLSGGPGNYISSRAFPPWSDEHARQVYPDDHIVAPHDFLNPLPGQPEVQVMPDLSAPFSWPHERPICQDLWMSSYATWCAESARLEREVFPAASQLFIDGNVGDGLSGEALGIDWRWHYQEGEVRGEDEVEHLEHAFALVLACTTWSTFCPFNFDRIGELVIEAHSRTTVETP